MQLEGTDFEIKVYREVSDYHQPEINRFNGDLTDISEVFRPYISKHHKVQLLREDEMPLAYNNARPGTEIFSMSPIEVLYAIQERLYNLGSFENSILASVHDIGIDRKFRKGHTFQVPNLSLSAPLVLEERENIVEYIQGITGFKLHRGLIQIHSGQLQGSADGKKFQKEANARNASGEYDFEQILINPGLVRLSKPSSKRK